MSRGIGLLSNRVRKIPSTEVESVAPDRFSFIDVSTSEADLGVPPGDDYFLTSDTQGQRAWIPPSSIGLNGEENELVFIKEGISASTTNIEFDESTNSIKFQNAFQTKGAVESLTKVGDSAVVEGVIASFDRTKFGSAKFIVQADEIENAQRQLSELLVVHDGTNASATEYGVIQSSSYEIAEYDVRITGDLVELVATNLTENSTTYRVVETLMLI
jgi:hypothetical protein